MIGLFEIITFFAQIKVFFWILTVIIGFLGFFAGWFLYQKISERKLKSAKILAKKILDEAEKEAERKIKSGILEAKEEWHKQRAIFEKETSARKFELDKREQRIRENEGRLNQRAELIRSRENDLKNKEREIHTREISLKKKEEIIEEKTKEIKIELQRLARMTTEEAKELLLKMVEEDAKKEATKIANEIKEKARLDAEKEAKNIIVMAIQRSAVENMVENSVSIVNLPDDEMKGRIIGREGRNIRSFETATGVDVIIDDTPEAVILSSFDPVRREIARLSMERLILDGRIHPARIEEIVEKAKEDIEKEIFETGERTLIRLGIGKMHNELIKYIGKLKYRTSYSQNVLNHSIEVAQLAGVMAAELGFDVDLAKRCALLHDIGKAADQGAEGTHTQIGIELAKKYGENEIVINTIASHHGEVEPIHPIPILVQAADAISGARPGARRESLEAYIKRLEKLEEIANKFPGVEKSYAIQAGREIRIIVSPDKISDLEMDDLANKISKEIEANLQYPGHIKVVVIRELRATSFAK